MIHPFEAMAVAIIGMSDPIRWGGRLGIWGMWSSSVNQRIAKDVVSAGKSLFGELESLDEPPPNKDGGEPVTLEEAWASLGDAFKVLEIFERALRAGIVDERFRAVLALSCLFDEEEPLPETAHAIVGDIPPIGGDPLWAWAWCAVGWSEVEVIRRTEYAAHTVEDPEWFWDRMDMTAKRLGWSHVASEVAKRNR